jgi:hypothetical protein
MKSKHALYYIAAVIAVILIRQGTLSQDGALSDGAKALVTGLMA